MPDLKVKDQKIADRLIKSGLAEPIFQACPVVETQQKKDKEPKKIEKRTGEKVK